MRISDFLKNKILITILLVSLLFTTFAYAGAIFPDYKYTEGESTIRPTAESTINEDTISAAERIVASSNLNSNFEGPSQNIYSKTTMYQEPVTITTFSDAKPTQIRRTQSISIVDEGTYYTLHDEATNRIMLKIRIPNKGEWFATNGFYKVNGKTFYFDENGLMVLGPAVDSSGKTYMFSYETGELLEQK